MVKRLKEKMNTLLQARKENKNKGFTLVELIVVIVILAILVGVTIGGIYGYVNKSRINTDINNASAIQSACAVLGTDKNVVKSVIAGKDIKVDWNSAVKKDAIIVTNDIKVDSDTNYVKTKLGELLPDGLPAPKVADHFVLTVSKEGTDNIKVICKAYTTTATGSGEGATTTDTALEAQE